jgi:hypothetical protein
MKRGRKRRSHVYETLKECLDNCPAAITGDVWEVPFEGKNYYIVTTSSANAVRDVAYHVGLTARRVSLAEVVKETKKGKDEPCQS